MIYIQHTPDGIRAEREPFDGGVAYGEVGEPVAWMHTLHMERGQTMERLSDWDGVDDDCPELTAFGRPGRDYSEEYPVTTTPLYTGASANNELVDALSKGGFMMTETHNVGEHRGRKLVIGFQNPDDADDAMQVIAAALTAHRKAS